MSTFIVEKTTLRKVSVIFVRPNNMIADIYHKTNVTTDSSPRDDANLPVLTKSV